MAYSRCPARAWHSAPPRRIGLRIMFVLHEIGVAGLAQQRGERIISPIDKLRRSIGGFGVPCRTHSNTAGAQARIIGRHRVLRKVPQHRPHQAVIGNAGCRAQHKGAALKNCLQAVNAIK